MPKNRPFIPHKTISSEIIRPKEKPLYRGYKGIKGNPTTVNPRKNKQKKIRND